MNPPNVIRALDELWYAAPEGLPVPEPVAARGAGEPTGPARHPERWLAAENAVFESSRARICRAAAERRLATESLVVMDPLHGPRSPAVCDSPWHRHPQPVVSLARTACAWAFVCRFWLEAWHREPWAAEDAEAATDRLRRIPRQLAIAAKLLRDSAALGPVESQLVAWLEWKRDDLNRRVAWLQLPADPPAWRTPAAGNGTPRIATERSRPTVGEKMTVNEEIAAHARMHFRIVPATQGMLPRRSRAA